MDEPIKNKSKEEKKLEEKLAGCIIYRPYNVVFKNRAVDYNKPASHSSCDFKKWKDFYLKSYKVNIAEKIVYGVVNGKFIDVSMGKLLDLGEYYEDFGNSIRRICMKSVYTGRNPIEELRKLLEFNLEQGSGGFMAQCELMTAS